jgi:hypothetical protein
MAVGNELFSTAPKEGNPMAEKTLRTAFEESKKVAREAAARAKDAMEPRLKAVRDAAGRIRDQIGHPHPRVDRSARTVEGERYVYEVHEADRGAKLDGSYTVHRRTGYGGTEFVGSFDVRGSTMTVRCAERIAISEISFVATAWLEQPSSPPSSSS